MRWPWVSRRVLDMLEHRRVDAVERAERAEAFHAAAQRLYASLLEKYHEAVRPPPVVVPPTAPAFQSFPPAVAAALAKACTGAPKDVARAVYQKARAMLDAGGQEADVAAAVLKGERVELAD